ncbi:MAG: TlpA disulfide reductase family protein [Verrucomicrobiota bacterium]
MKHISLAKLAAVAAGILFFAHNLAANPDNFTVPSATGGGKFTLAEAKGKFVAVHFLLKTECPVCLRHTREYATKAATLPNVVQVFLKPDSAGDIKAWAGKLPADLVAKYPIYRDADAALAKAFKVPDGYKFHGEVVHYPALVLLDPDGKEVFRHVGKSNSDRFSFEKLAAKVEELRK